MMFFSNMFFSARLKGLGHAILGNFVSFVNYEPVKLAEQESFICVNDILI